MPRDAQHGERVLVRIDPRHVTQAHLPLGQSRVHIEIGGGGEISPRVPALHPVDEIEERRVLRAAQARREARARRAQRRAGPRAHQLVRDVQAPHEPRLLGHGTDGEQVGPQRGDPPPPARRVACEPDVNDGETLGPVLRLDEVHAVDHRVPDLAV